MDFLLSANFIILLLLICSALYIHFRGKRKHKFTRQLTDHSTFMAPINLLMYLFSKVPNKPFLQLADFPELDEFSRNWETIREEALDLEKQELIKGSNKYNDVGFNSFFRRGWKRFYLKWYGDYHPSAVKHCPKTIEMLEKTKSIKAAMYVVLPAGSKLPEHRDPYAGSLRYHLGLITPNNEKCFINVDDETYSWKDGEAVLFDETYVHHAENYSDKDRLIFFADVERPMINRVGRYLNSFFSWFILRSAASPNTEKDKTGFLNRIFGTVYQFRLLGKRVKRYNRTLYYAIKYLLFGLIIYLLFF